MATRRLHPRRTAAAAMLLVAVIALAGCGSSSSSGQSSASSAPHVHFAKTKFLLHAGLAFGAFHRYIYKPFRNGGFTPVSSHKLAIVKAGAAGLFAYHEVKIALVDARSSATLSKLVSPLTALQTRLSSLGHQLHGGHLNPAAITGANSSVSNLTGLGAKSGAAIHDLATPSLGQ
jgi:hypothetical protein